MIASNQKYTYLPVRRSYSYKEPESILISKSFQHLLDFFLYKNQIKLIEESLYCCPGKKKELWLCPSPARCLKSERALLIFYKALYSSNSFPPFLSSASLPSFFSLSPRSIPQWSKRPESHKTIKRKMA